MGIIYKLRSPNGNEYIGQTIQAFNERMNKHKSASAKLDKTDGCRYLNNAIRKYGWNAFEKEIILECSNEDINFWEELCVALYNTLAPNGYNLTTGGDSSLKSEVTKAKMRESALMRDSVHYRKSEETKLLPKYVGKYNNGFKIAKHPNCPIKYFCDSSKTSDENLADCLEILHKLNTDNIVIEPKKHDLPAGVQRMKNGYRVRFRNKHGNVIIKLFTVQSMPEDIKLQNAIEHLNKLKNDN